MSQTQNAPTDRDTYRGQLVSKLNDRQAEAVTLPYESALVLAGAGSGKTSVLTARIAYLINEGIHPANLMAVTFTNKASEEMRKRLRKVIQKDDVQSIWLGTFHSLCNKLLRVEFEAADLPKNFAILDMDSQESLIRTVIKGANLAGTDADEDTTESKEDKITPKTVANFINRNKEFGVRYFDIQAPSGSKEEIMVDLFRRYQESCAQQGLLDFNDLLYKTVELLESNATVRNTYRAKFQGILVDEFQDTNDIQYRWLELIKGDDSFVMAVGDDDQSIYGFRGANPQNMQRFAREMSNERIIKLERNYRSLPYILDSANAIIAKNSNRLGKELWTEARDAGEKIQCTEFGNGYFEAKAIARDIHALVKEQKMAPSEIAVLYRTNAQSRGIEQELNKLSIPLTVYGGFRFYERQEVKNVLAYLDLVTSMDRDISFARVVNFPPRAIGERTVEDLRQEAKELGVSMMEMVSLRAEEVASGSSRMVTSGAQKKQFQLESFASMLLDFMEMAETTTLSALIEHVVAASGIRKHYEESTKKSDQEEAQERMSNIGELVSAAKQFELDHPELTNAAEVLPEYLSFVQLMTSTSEADMDKKNTVSLMTVHSSKGLEFDHVFIAGMEDNIFPHARALAVGNGIALEKAFAGPMIDTDDPDFEYREEGDAQEADEVDSEELEEERRLMYVAVTRARKSLKISHATKRMVNGQENAMTPSRFIEEIPKARIKKTREFGTYTNNKFSAGNVSASTAAEQEDNKLVSGFLKNKRRFGA